MNDKEYLLVSELIVGQVYVDRLSKRELVIVESIGRVDTECGFIEEGERVKTGYCFNAVTGKYEYVTLNDNQLYRNLTDEEKYNVTKEFYKKHIV